MTTSRQRWRQCRSMGVPLLFAGRAANETTTVRAGAAFEQRASSVRELARTTRELATSANSGELTRELRGAPVWRVAAPGFPCLTHIVYFS